MKKHEEKRKREKVQWIGGELANNAGQKKEKKKKKKTSLVVVGNYRTVGGRAVSSESCLCHPRHQKLEFYCLFLS